jgi:hypothetical protein
LLHVVRHGGLPPNLYGKEVPAMTDFEILSTVIGIIGLLIALYAAVKEKIIAKMILRSS